MKKVKRQKFGGRKKGTPNKTTQELREFIQVFLEGQFENLENVFQELKPRDKVNAFIKMLPYVLPRQMQMDVNATHKQETIYDYSNLTTEELLQLKAIMEKTKNDESNS